ncbi:hypothetical protein ACHAWT_001798 [Skeletonema menzelii]|mmetsp:Transcript_17233/g.28183  ORF Transcript_17233/g.28183 Transcript_17233/m.28183 type:complete len:225 (+) Transcript_17233:65-739(+)
MVGLHRPSTPPGMPPPSARRRPSKLSFGTVCSSNINRSMEAHVRLQNAGMRVESYGTGTQVRLPGKSAMEPRIFKFGTPYADMYKSLSETPEDVAFFMHNGVLQLCKRGASVKVAPKRWQDTPTTDVQNHDVVIAFEERIYDAVIEDLQCREPTEEFKAIHVICLDTKDNPHEAQLQGTVALELCWLLEQTEDLDSEAPELVEQFQEQQMTHTQIKVLHQICYL